MLINTTNNDAKKETGRNFFKEFFGKKKNVDQDKMIRLIRIKVGNIFSFPFLFLYDYVVEKKQYYSCMYKQHG
jgi:hypothetical protein